MAADRLPFLVFELGWGWPRRRAWVVVLPIMTLESAVPVVVTAIVGVVLVLIVGLFLWSNLKAAGSKAIRPAQRPESAAPDGMRPGHREPEALRSALALTGRGELVTAGPPFVGSFRGEDVHVLDLVVRHAKGADPQVLTVATVDVTWRWPWMRLRHVDLPVADVEGRAVELEPKHIGSAVARWGLDAADRELALDLVTPELVEWIERLGQPVVVETTPRHLVVATPVLPDDRLGDLVDVATGIIDHVPTRVRDRIAAPDPRDDT